MHQPAHVDGCSVVILRRTHLGYVIIDSGLLSFDGETLTLGEGDAARVVSHAELRALLTVAQDSRISACRGFDFFVLHLDEAPDGSAAHSVPVDGAY
jgi:hypothetical protein